jgi:Protein of unknown function (DUF3304)
MRLTGRLFALMVVLSLAACQPGPAAERTPPKSASKAASSPWDVQEFEKDGRTPQTYSVVAYGYNYTDLYIDSFEVNGAGGGNLAVSTPTTPGGGHTCCALLVSGLPEGTEFVIKWTRNRKRWCEQTVALTRPVPKSPRYLEVHFYPDGKVEIEGTQQASPPRLKLDRHSRGERHEAGNVSNDEKFSRCKDGYR